MHLPFGLDLISLLVGAVLYHLFMAYRAKKASA